MPEPTTDPGPRGILFNQPESVAATANTFQFDVAGVQLASDSPITSNLTYTITCYPSSGNSVGLKVTGSANSPAQSITVPVSTPASGQLVCDTVSITASWSSTPPALIAIGVTVSGTTSGGTVNTPSSGPTNAFIAIT